MSLLLLFMYNLTVNQKIKKSNETPQEQPPTFFKSEKEENLKSRTANNLLP